jgi:hypothetical protein
MSAVGVAFRKSIAWDDRLSADTCRGPDMGDFVVGEIFLQALQLKRGVLKMPRICSGIAL